MARRTPTCRSPMSGTRSRWPRSGHTRRRRRQWRRASRAELRKARTEVLRDPDRTIDRGVTLATNGVPRNPGAGGSGCRYWWGSGSGRTSGRTRMTMSEAERPRAGSRRKPVSLITAAEPSYDEQFRARRKRYVIMMSMRVPFLVAAALLYHTPWLAITLIVVSIPLPWCAVLVANDRPARKRRVIAPAAVNHERALPPG